MSRKLKKYKIEAEGKTVMKQTAIIIVGMDQETNQVQLNIQGKIGFEEAIDMLNTTQFELINTFFNSIKDNKEIDKDKAKREIYDRAVLGFSLMIDKFLPEAKDDKYAGFTDEAVLEAQNNLLKKRIKQKAKGKA
jgi:transcriptional regulator of heat shock response